MQETTPNTSVPLEYVDHDGVRQRVRGCTTRLDKAGRHWLHCTITQTNLAYKERTREDMLLSALNSALYYVELWRTECLELRDFKHKFNAFVESVSKDKERDSF